MKFQTNEDKTLNAIEAIVDSNDLLEDPFYLCNTDSPGRSQINIANSTNSTLSEESQFQIKKNDILSNDPKVTVIASSDHEEIFELVPLFSLSDLVHKEKESVLPLVNLYSPVLSGKSVQSSAKASPLLENSNTMSVQKLLRALESSDTNSEGDSRTLNEVIFGNGCSFEFVSGMMGTKSPTKSTNSSLFDTPKSSPVLDCSIRRSPRVQFLCQQFNQLEKDTTPDRSLHFLAEIASAATASQTDTDYTERLHGGMTIQLPDKVKQDITRVKPLFHHLLFNEFRLNHNNIDVTVQLQNKVTQILDKSGDTVKSKKQIQGLVKLLALLISKTWALSKLQEKMLVMRSKQIVKKDFTNTSSVYNQLKTREAVAQCHFDDVPPSNELLLQPVKQHINFDNNVKKLSTIIMENRKKESSETVFKTKTQKQVFKTANSANRRSSFDRGVTPKHSSRNRKRPQRYNDYTDIPVDNQTTKKKKKKIKYSNTDIATSEKNNNVFVFIPANYDNTLNIDEKTNLIPSSTFKCKLSNNDNVSVKKTVVQLLGERNSSSTILSPAKKTQIDKQYTVYETDGTKLETDTEPIKQNMKSMAGNCIGERNENGEKYEIFQSM